MNHPIGVDMSDPKVFAYWSELAKSDPERCERERVECIEQLIANASESQKVRLRGLQWQIDTALTRSTTPLSRCLRMSQLMWDHITGPHGFLSTSELWDEVRKGLADIARDARGIPRLNSQPFSVIDGESHRVPHDTLQSSALIIPLSKKSKE